jgi:hypothetical protein
MENGHIYDWCDSDDDVVEEDSTGAKKVDNNVSRRKRHGTPPFTGLKKDGTPMKDPCDFFESSDDESAGSNDESIRSDDESASARSDDERARKRICAGNERRRRNVVVFTGSDDDDDDDDDSKPPYYHPPDPHHSSPMREAEQAPSTALSSASSTTGEDEEMLVNEDNYAESEQDDDIQENLEEMEVVEPGEIEVADPGGRDVNGDNRVFPMARADDHKLKAPASLVGDCDSCVVTGSSLSEVAGKISVDGSSWSIDTKLLIFSANQSSHTHIGAGGEFKPTTPAGKKRQSIPISDFPNVRLGSLKSAKFGVTFFLHAYLLNDLKVGGKKGFQTHHIGVLVAAMNVARRSPQIFRTFQSLPPMVKMDYSTNLLGTNPFTNGGGSWSKGTPAKLNGQLVQL